MRARSPSLLSPEAALLDYASLRPAYQDVRRWLRDRGYDVNTSGGRHAMHARTSVFHFDVLFAWHGVASNVVREYKQIGFLAFDEVVRS